MVCGITLTKPRCFVCEIRKLVGRGRFVRDAIAKDRTRRIRSWHGKFRVTASPGDDDIDGNVLNVRRRSCRDVERRG